jgi:large subunit ribosomal protein L31
MKQGIHPGYGPVVFRDRSADFAFLTRSTLGATGADASGRALETVEWEDGHTYPVVDVEISSASHPFYTGTARVVDTAGRVEKFRRRYGAAAPASPAGPSTADQTTEGDQS